MKNILYAFIFSCTVNSTSAQLTNGSTVPDFTFTDINGVAQNLYSYLNAGKYVAIDISATWCHPCWDYHVSGVMDSLYTKHDLPGDQAWKVLFIEGDGNTTLADLQGTGTNTVGNWVSSALFPIMNPTGIPLNDFLSYYNVSFFPTLYLICPNKKIYQDTLNAGTKPSVQTWEYVANSKCGPTGLDNIKDTNPLTIYPNPARDFVMLYFGLDATTKVTLTITNILGQVVDAKNFGLLFPGDQSVKYDISRLNSGIYFFTIYDGVSRYIRKKIVVQ